MISSQGSQWAGRRWCHGLAVPFCAVPALIASGPLAAIGGFVGVMIVEAHERGNAIEVLIVEARIEAFMRRFADLDAIQSEQRARKDLGSELERFGLK